MVGWALAIDFGTSNTTAMVRRPDGMVEPLLFDGAPTLPSAVYATPSGELLTGRDAVYSARLAPERFEPNPKLRIDDGTLLLGVEISVQQAIAAVLRRVAAEAQVLGAVPGPNLPVVLTHPVSWGPTRRGLLRSAATAAGLGNVVFESEPAAAARATATTEPDAVLGPAVAGEPTVIYDLGGGTFDVSVLADGRVLASDGLGDAGGLDIDAAIIAHLGAAQTRQAQVWQRLIEPASAEEQRAARQLRDDVRTAKEILSRTAQTFLHLPLLDVDAPLGREQLEAIALPLLDRTIATTRATISAAGLSLPLRGRLVLVGGGSRMPLVATLLHRQLGAVPELADQPELVVARGALHALPSTPDAVPDQAPPVAVPDSIVPVAGSTLARPTAAAAPDASVPPVVPGAGRQMPPVRPAVAAPEAPPVPSSAPAVAWAPAATTSAKGGRLRRGLATLRRHPILLAGAAVLAAVVTVTALLTSYPPPSQATPPAAHTPTPGRVSASASHAPRLAVTDRIRVGAGPMGVGVDPGVHRAYVANSNDGTVSVIDTATGTVIATPEVGGFPMDVAVDASAHRAYVTNGVNVSVFGTDKLIATIDVAGATGVAVDSHAHRAYVATSTKGTVTVVDTVTRKVVDKISVSGDPVPVTVDASAHRAYVGDTGRVLVINTATDKVTRTFDDGHNVLDIRVDPDAHRAYVANNDDGSVSVLVIDTVSSKAIKTIKFGDSGNSSASVAVDAAAHRAYTTEDDAGKVLVIDTATDRTIRTIPVGGSPDGVAVDATTHRVYVTEFSEDTVAVLAGR